MCSISLPEHLFPIIQHETKALTLERMRVMVLNNEELTSENLIRHPLCSLNIALDTSTEQAYYKLDKDLSISLHCLSFN